MLKSTSLISLLFLGIACSTNNPDPVLGEFANPTLVNIEGYTGSAMEPFISLDGQTLFFNNPNEGVEDGDIHYATKQSNGDFKYAGLVEGVNTPGFEGAPSLDNSGNFYYTSTFTYLQDLLSIYGGSYQNGIVAGSVPVDQNLTLNQPGFVDMDASVSPDGSTLYLAIGLFSGNTYPDEANFIIANKINGVFIKDPNSDFLLTNINTDNLEYAASISVDGLTLYFNRTNISGSPFTFQIMVATRPTINDAFGAPVPIKAITSGFVEGASISADNRELYYHTKINGLLQIYKVSR
jgi:WD40-like Beta Propeller Repeat